MSENLFKDPIKSERRRRNQAYQSLDYMLSRITYFDFFNDISKRYFIDSLADLDLL